MSKWYSQFSIHPNVTETKFLAPEVSVLLFYFPGQSSTLSRQFEVDCHKASFSYAYRESEESQKKKKRQISSSPSHLSFPISY